MHHHHRARDSPPPPPPPSLLLPLPVSLLYTPSLPRAAGVARDTKRKRPTTRGERPPSPTRRPAGASGSGFFAFGNDCTVGTRVGATVGRGGGFGFERSTTSQLSRTTCAPCALVVSTAAGRASDGGAARPGAASAAAASTARRRARSPGQGRLQTPAASARPVDSIRVNHDIYLSSILSRYWAML